MATNRKIVFRNEDIYHVFNRGVERRVVFINNKDLERARNLIKFYRHQEVPVRFSQVYRQPVDIRQQILSDLYKTPRLVDILAFCLMPNHFHFLLKQNSERGVPTFVANFTNAYTKYFNTKHERTGPLFEGVFKAVYVESDEQLVHLSRYIHLNPVVSSVVKDSQLSDYAWSSYPEYLSLSKDAIIQKEVILNMFKTVDSYREFVGSQIMYGKQLDSIKQLTLE
jgi:putative transposase